MSCQMKMSCQIKMSCQMKTFCHMEMSCQLDMSSPIKITGQIEMSNQVEFFSQRKISCQMKMSFLVEMSCQMKMPCHDRVLKCRNRNFRWQVNQTQPPHYVCKGDMTCTLMETTHFTLLWLMFIWFNLWKSRKDSGKTVLVKRPAEMFLTNLKSLGNLFPQCHSKGIVPKVD